MLHFLFGYVTINVMEKQVINQIQKESDFMVEQVQQNHEYWENSDYLTYKDQLETFYPGLTKTDLYFSFVELLIGLGQQSTI